MRGDRKALRARPAWLPALLLPALLLLVLLTAGPLAVGADMGSAGAVTAAMPSPPVGRWLSQDHDGVFDIRVCGATLCGRLVGMRYEGSMPLDNLGHPQCGLMMLTGFEREADDPARWAGEILDPEHGATYHATIWSPEPGRLNLHGYLLLPLFGRTEHWTRYEGDIGQACHLPR